MWVFLVVRVPHLLTPAYYLDGVYSVSKEVKSVIKTLSSKGPRANLEKFTSFRTRCKSLLSPLPVLRLTFAQTTVVRYHYPDRSSHFCANRRLDRQAKPTVVVQQDH